MNKEWMTKDNCEKMMNLDRKMKLKDQREIISPKVYNWFHHELDLGNRYYSPYEENMSSKPKSLSERDVRNLRRWKGGYESPRRYLTNALDGSPRTIQEAYWDL